ncbi:uncharacterized protein LOC122353752 [Puntigrus tetrazona]|uniref:uncharacterized protein LOC122353752 n=1 Tax=Puntigrus tetrazona TaxID=1606681 RepID=UPI001C8A2048|nr:uncharacterized protein LOC122353752 [Puntigrus tetrazona]
MRQPSAIYHVHRKTSTPNNIPGVSPKSIPFYTSALPPLQSRTQRNLPQPPLAVCPAQQTKQQREDRSGNSCKPGLASPLAARRCQQRRTCTEEYSFKCSKEDTCCRASALDVSVSTSETRRTNATTVQDAGITDPGDTSQTTTQLITIQQKTQRDVPNNTETSTSQSTRLPQTTELKIMSTADPSETFPAEANSTAYITDLGHRGQDTATNPGLVAVLCIFCIVVAVVAVVVIVKAARSRKPQFERLDDVPMGKVNEDAPFARYPPK